MFFEKGVKKRKVPSRGKKKKAFAIGRVEFIPTDGKENTGIFGVKK